MPDKNEIDIEKMKAKFAEMKAKGQIPEGIKPGSMPGGPMPAGAGKGPVTGKPGGPVPAGFGKGPMPGKSGGPAAGPAMKGPMPALKPKSFKDGMGKLLGYMKKHRTAMVLAAILAMAGSVLNLIGPGKLAEMTKLIQDGLRTTIDTEAVVKVAVLLLILYGAGFLFSVLQGQVMAWVTQKTARELRSLISDKINRLPLKYFDSHSTGDTLSRMTNDVDTIGTTMNQSMGNLVSDGTMFIGCLIMMFITNWILALSAVAATMIGFVLMKMITSKSQKYFILQQYGLGAINGLVEETFTGHTVVKAYNGEKQVKAVFDKMNQGLYKSAWKSQFISGLMPSLMSFIGNLGYVVVCVVGAVLTMKGIIGFEVIVAFVMYVRLFTQPVNDFAQIVTNLQSTAAASERVFAFLSEKEMSDESEKQPVEVTVKGNVEFDHVRFGYDPDRIIIHDFSADVKAGQKIAIVGPTGAGKTTMVNLLMRFYDLNSGEIRLEGIPTQTMRREDVHNKFCMVLQDTWLFEGTIRENIRYSKTDANDEDVIRACKTVGLHRFIMTLPQGYDTVLTDDANLSVGQRQLVTIARAMVENAPMLILDEATSSVDTRTEIQIQKAMDELMKGRTSFVIAHRLSTIKNADRILFMKDGDIVESGNHEELMVKGGQYAELYRSQFE